MGIKGATARDRASSTVFVRLSFVLKWLGVMLCLTLAFWEIVSAAMALSDAGGNWRQCWQYLLPEAAGLFWPLATVYVVYSAVALVNAVSGLRRRGHAVEFWDSSTEYNPTSGYLMIGDSGLDAGGYMYGSGPDDS